MLINDDTIYADARDVVADIKKPSASGNCSPNWKARKTSGHLR